MSPLASWRVQELGLEITEENTTEQDQVTLENDENTDTITCDNHRIINSEVFHNMFASKLAIRRSDGVLVHSNNPSRAYGVSNIRSHRCVPPELYRRNGVLRAGRASHIIEKMASLPGYNATIGDARRLLPLMSDLFRATLSNESDLTHKFYGFCISIMRSMGEGPVNFLSKCNVALGAYGAVAYSKRSDNRAIRYLNEENEPQSHNGKLTYAAKDVAVIGKCDRVFYSGQKTGTIVAVVEAKIYNPPRRVHYCRANNSICAQIFTSFIGSNATLAIILGNGVFKLIWKKKNDGEYLFFTYPSGNDLAQFCLPENKLIFAQVMFHVVRCSIVTEAKPEDEIMPDLSSRVVETELKQLPMQSKTTTTLTAKVDVKDIEYQSARTVSGDKFEFARYPMNHWTEEELLSLSKDLRQQEYERKEMELLNDFSDSFES